MIEKIISNPKKLFLIDGLGAILSAFLLGVVLVKAEIYFGIPSSTLYVLATIPILFAIYDLYCYRKDRSELGYSLKGIAILNLLYCFLSIGFACYHFKTLTIFGWFYVLIEILTVFTLAYIEYNTATKLILNSKSA